MYYICKVITGFVFGGDFLGGVAKEEKLFIFLLYVYIKYNFLSSGSSDLVGHVLD